MHLLYLTFRLLIVLFHSQSFFRAWINPSRLASKWLYRNFFPSCLLVFFARLSTWCIRGTLSLVQTYLVRQFKLFLHIISIFAQNTHTGTFVPNAGPEKRIIVLGKPVTTCRFSVGHIHSVLSILSFNGMLNITLCADDEAIPGVQYFAVFYMKALVAIAEEYNVAIPESVKVAAAKPLVSKVKES